MYDEHIFCEEYKDLKNLIIDIINGDNMDTDLDALQDHIYELYSEGQMSSKQYDKLMVLMDEI